MYFLPQPFDDHVKANEVVDSMGTEAFKSYFSFAFVRNPWAWVLSRYTYTLKNPRHKRHQLVTGGGSFEGYLQWLSNEEELFYLQKDFVCNSEGERLVNFIGKQEQLDNDFAHVCGAIGINATLPVFNVSSSSSYRDFYTTDSRKLVEDMYAEDIEYFKYKFLSRHFNPVFNFFLSCNFAKFLALHMSKCGKIKTFFLRFVILLLCCGGQFGIKRCRLGFKFLISWNFSRLEHHRSDTIIVVLSLASSTFLCHRWAFLLTPKVGVHCIALIELYVVNPTWGR